MIVCFFLKKKNKSVSLKIVFRAMQSAMNTLRANAAVLITASMHALVALIVFATLLYFTESNGIYRDEFNSIPKSMYFTLIFMTGELPLYDFTTPGKFIVCVVALFAVSFVYSFVMSFCSHIIISLFFKMSGCNICRSNCCFGCWICKIDRKSCKQWW
jgi:hypothetical protein